MNQTTDNRALLIFRRFPPVIILHMSIFRYITRDPTRAAQTEDRRDRDQGKDPGSPGIGATTTSPELLLATCGDASLPSS